MPNDATSSGTVSRCTLDSWRDGCRALECSDLRYTGSRASRSQHEVVGWVGLCGLARAPELEHLAQAHLSETSS